jgi:hypothetical protein
MYVIPEPPQLVNEGVEAAHKKRKKLDLFESRNHRITALSQKAYAAPS